MRICVQSYSICPRNVLKYIIGAQNAISIEFRGGADRIRGGADPIRGGADRIRGGADRIRGGADPIRGGADRIQGGADRIRGKATYSKKKNSSILMLSPIRGL